MPEYKKVGYLTTSFKMFHLKDTSRREFHYHYHDFHKILILLGGDVTYCIEGRTYQLAPGDIVLVNAGKYTNPRSTRIFPTSASFYMSPRIFLRSTPGKTAISPSALSRRTASRHTSSVCRIPRAAGSAPPSARWTPP